MSLLNNTIIESVQHLKSIDRKYDYREMDRYIGVLPEGFCQDNILIAVELFGKDFRKLFEVYEGVIVDTDGHEYYHWAIGRNGKIIEITYLPWLDNKVHHYIMKQVSIRAFINEWGYINDDYPISPLYARHILKTCLEYIDT